MTAERGAALAVLRVALDAARAAVRVARRVDGSAAAASRRVVAGFPVVAVDVRAWRGAHAAFADAVRVTKIGRRFARRPVVEDRASGGSVAVSCVEEIRLDLAIAGDGRVEWEDRHVLLGLVHVVGAARIDDGVEAAATEEKNGERDAATHASIVTRIC